MNGNYYQNPMFNANSTSTAPPGGGMNNIGANYEANKVAVDMPNDLPMEQSYIENILRMNKGKRITAYVSFPDSVEWRDRKFYGIVEEAGRDHLILSDPKTGKWYLILMIYLDYIEFDERINYKPNYPVA